MINRQIAAIEIALEAEKRATLADGGANAVEHMGRLSRLLAMLRGLTNRVAPMLQRVDSEKE